MSGKSSMACSVQGEWLQTSLTGSTFKVVAVPDAYAPGDEVSSPLSSFFSLLLPLLLCHLLLPCSWIPLPPLLGSPVILQECG